MSSRRAELVDAAVEELARRGALTMSLRPLARALGTSDRMLLHYFGSREALISAVLAEAFDRLAATRFDSGSTVRGLWAGLSAERARPAVRLYLEASALAHTDPALRGALAPLTADWLARLELWLVQDGVRPDQARSVAGMVSACLDGCLLRLGTDGPSPDVDAVVTTLASVIAGAPLARDDVTGHTTRG